jgi:hypothetical protein
MAYPVSKLAQDIQRLEQQQGPLDNNKINDVLNHFATLSNSRDAEIREKTGMGVVEMRSIARLEQRLVQNFNGNGVAAFNFIKEIGTTPGFANLDFARLVESNIASQLIDLKRTNPTGFEQIKQGTYRDMDVLQSAIQAVRAGPRVSPAPPPTIAETTTPVLQLGITPVSNSASYRQNFPDMVVPNGATMLRWDAAQNRNVSTPVDAIRVWQFDPNIANASNIARSLQGRLPDVSSINDSFKRQISEMQTTLTPFSNADRTALKAVQDDLASRPPTDPSKLQDYWKGMADLERICRQAGLPPKPNYPGIEAPIPTTTAAAPTTAMPAVANGGTVAAPTPGAPQGGSVPWTSGSTSIVFQNPDAAPAVSYRFTENGPRATLGHVLIDPVPGRQPPFPGVAQPDGKLVYWGFDKATLAGSKVAQFLEGHAGSYHAAGILQTRLDQLKAEGYQFTELDRATIKAIQTDINSRPPTFANDMERRAYEESRQRIEIISRQMGNPPSPGFPNLGPSGEIVAAPAPAPAPGGGTPAVPAAITQEAFEARMKTFYGGLNPAQKEGFVSPYEAEPKLRPALVMGRIDDGRDRGGPMEPEAALAFEQRLQEKWKQDLVKFEQSLTPAQRTEWDEMKRQAEANGYRVGIIEGQPAVFKVDPKPAGAPAPAPAGTPAPAGGGTPAPATTTTSATPSFEISMTAGPPFTFDPNVLKAQGLMQQMKAVLPPDQGAAINLGTFKNSSGTGADGLDGKFGTKTRDSIIATEKLLGIDPPTGKITPELLTKMDERVKALAAANPSVTVTARPDPVPTIASPIPTTLNIPGVPATPGTPSTVTTAAPGTPGTPSTPVSATTTTVTQLPTNSGNALRDALYEAYNKLNATPAGKAVVDSINARNFSSLNTGERQMVYDAIGGAPRLQALVLNETFKNTEVGMPNAQRIQMAQNALRGYGLNVSTADVTSAFDRFNASKSAYQMESLGVRSAEDLQQRIESKLNQTDAGRLALMSFKEKGFAGMSDAERGTFTATLSREPAFMQFAQNIGVAPLGNEMAANLRKTPEGTALLGKLNAGGMPALERLSQAEMKLFVQAAGGESAIARAAQQVFENKPFPATIAAAPIPPAPTVAAPVTPTVPVTPVQTVQAPVVEEEEPEYHVVPELENDGNNAGTFTPPAPSGQSDLPRVIMASLEEPNAPEMDDDLRQLFEDRDLLVAVRMQGDSEEIDRMLAEAYGVEPEQIRLVAMNGAGVTESGPDADAFNTDMGMKAKGMAMA